MKDKNKKRVAETCGMSKEIEEQCLNSKRFQYDGETQKQRVT
jgi:hypothetical protein